MKSWLPHGSLTVDLAPNTRTGHGFPLILGALQGSHELNACALHMSLEEQSLSIAASKNYLSLAGIVSKHLGLQCKSSKHDLLTKVFSKIPAFLFGNPPSSVGKGFVGIEDIKLGTIAWEPLEIGAERGWCRERLLESPTMGAVKGSLIF